MIIQIEITDEELTCFKHDVLESPREWLQKAWRGKASSCRGRMVQQELPKVLAEPLAKPIATESDLLESIITRPGYMDRAAREKEAQDAEKDTLRSR